jgi:thiol-disulfide isomerase/thioredoxin
MKRLFCYFIFTLLFIVSSFSQTTETDGNSGKENSFTLLVFWDTTCPPCIEELIALNILEKEFQGLQVVAITKDSSEKVNNFMTKFHFKWNNIVILPNYKQELESVFKTRIVPVSLLLDSENIIKEMYTGNNLREMIVSLDGFY